MIGTEDHPFYLHKLFRNNFIEFRKRFDENDIEQDGPGPNDQINPNIGGDGDGGQNVNAGQQKNREITIISFNARNLGGFSRPGLRGNRDAKIEYIIELQKGCDLLFLTEVGINGYNLDQLLADIGKKNVHSDYKFGYTDFYGADGNEECVFYGYDTSKVELEHQADWTCFDPNATRRGYIFAVRPVIGGAWSFVTPYHAPAVLYSFAPSKKRLASFQTFLENLLNAIQTITEDRGITENDLNAIIVCGDLNFRAKETEMLRKTVNDVNDKSGLVFKLCAPLDKSSAPIKTSFRNLEECLSEIAGDESACLGSNVDSVEMSEPYDQFWMTSNNEMNILSSDPNLFVEEYLQILKLHEQKYVFNIEKSIIKQDDDLGALAQATRGSMRRRVTIQEFKKSLKPAIDHLKENDDSNDYIPKTLSFYNDMVESYNDDGVLLPQAQGTGYPNEFNMTRERFNMISKVLNLQSGYLDKLDNYSWLSPEKQGYLIFRSLISDHLPVTMTINSLSDQAISYRNLELFPQDNSQKKSPNKKQRKQAKDIRTFIQSQASKASVDSTDDPVNTGMIKISKKIANTPVSSARQSKVTAQISKAESEKVRKKVQLKNTRANQDNIDNNFI